MPIEGTESEKIFEDFCITHKINYERISTSSKTGEQRPDYKVQAKTGRPIYIEIKQFDPNPLERAVLKAGKLTGRFDFPSSKIGGRIRSAIHKAAPQLKALSGGNYPAIIVIYNNVPFRLSHTNPYAVLTAMRGFDRISMIIPDKASKNLITGTVQTGSNKKFTAKDNTSVSSVAILFKNNSQDIMLNIYHNRFAKVPLQPDELYGEYIFHFQMAEDESDWISC